MKNLFKYSGCSAAVMIALTLTGCASYEKRMQANGTYEYQEASLVTPYTTGKFTNDEARDVFDIPTLTEKQLTGFTKNELDLRPPTQLIPVLDGVLLEATNDQTTKIWFHAFKENDDMKAKVMRLLESYLAQNNVEIVSKNEATQQIETGVFNEKVDNSSTFSPKIMDKESRYKFTIEQQQDGHSVALIVDLLSYTELNNDDILKVDLSSKSKQDIELRFINNLLTYAYHVKETEQLENADTNPLSIKLGFDDNHQSAWMVDSDFLDTWLKLPALFTLLNFEVVESDKNLGYFLLKYSKPDDNYWAENNLNPFELDNSEYFIQLGEVTGGITSISWSDEDKKPLPTQKVTEIYLSITEQVRGVLIEKDKQTKEF